MFSSIFDTVTNPNIHKQFADWFDKLISWSMSNGIKIVFIVGIALLIKVIAKRAIQRIVKTAVKSEKLQLEEADIKRMNTLVRIFNWTINTIIVVVASMMVMQEFGVEIAPILAGAGIAGVAIGFGGQYLVRDFITGFFIIFENQYRIGDVVNIEGIGGLVEDISLRVTTLRDLDGVVHYIPHGEIKKVSNFGKKFSRINLNVGVAYNTNLDLAKKVMNRVGIELAEDPQWASDFIKPPQFLRVDSLDDSSISLKIVGETKPLRQWDATGELRKRIKEAFEQEGIEIPFPQRVIHHIGEKSTDEISD